MTPLASGLCTAPNAGESRAAERVAATSDRCGDSDGERRDGLEIAANLGEWRMVAITAAAEGDGAMLTRGTRAGATDGRRGRGLVTITVGASLAGASFLLSWMKRRERTRVIGNARSLDSDHTK